MIINGGSRSNALWFTNHLTNAGENERVTLCEIRNLAASTVSESFQEMGAIAQTTQCKNWFYHANINPRGNELLTSEQWQTAVDRLETNLNLTDHARFVVEHKKYGRTHRHVIWSRIDTDRMRAVAMTDDYEQHQITARSLERSFGLQPEESVFERGGTKARPERRPENWETFRGKRSGIDPHTVKNEVTALWKSAKSGKKFAEELKARGYVLARGDKSLFCLVDKAGDSHSLTRRIAGIRLAQLVKFMKDITHKSLPSVDEARAAILGRKPIKPKQPNRNAQASGSKQRKSKRSPGSSKKRDAEKYP